MTAEIKARRQSKRHFTESEIVEWFLQMFEALDYLHQSKVLHRDLKTSNIFISKNGSLKIGDFGIAKVLENSHQKAQTMVGTPYYMSPEICQNESYSFKSDVWSLGCILFEMCNLKRAFEASNLLSLVTQIIDKPADRILPFYSPELNDLVQQMLIKNPDKRASIRELKNHVLLRDKLGSSTDGENESPSTNRLGITARMNICSFKGSGFESVNNFREESIEEIKSGDRTSLNSVDNYKNQKENKPVGQLLKKSVQGTLVKCFSKEKSLSNIKNQLESTLGNVGKEDNFDVTFESEIFGKKPVTKKEEIFVGKDTDDLEVFTKKLHVG